MTQVKSPPFLPDYPALVELKQAAQWVNYNAQKQPFSPKDGSPDKWETPEKWGTYARAEWAVRRFPDKYKGVGWVTRKEDGLVIFDLDHCRAADGTLTPFAQQIIAFIDSYCELSPSEHGIRIIARGSLSENIMPDIEADGDSRIEMYDHNKYLTITGKHLDGTPETIENRQAEITALYKETITRRAAQKKKPAQRAKRKVASIRTLAIDHSWCIAGLDEECAELASMGEDTGRNTQLNKLAYRFAGYVATGNLTEQTVEQKLKNAARSSGLGEREIDKTFSSGFDDGLNEPRTPPHAASEKHTRRGPRPSIAAGEETNGDNINEPRSLVAPGDTPLPDVVIGGQLRDVTQDALESLRIIEQKKPTMFVQSARLVQVACTEKKHPIIIQMGIAETKNALTRSANYYREKKVAEGKKGDQDVKKDEWVDVPVSPPKEIAESILALNPSEWPFPALEAIVETPVMRPDGSILDMPGYDAATRLYYYPQAGMDACKVPVTPTKQDIQAACAMIEEAIGEFPYVDQADRANAYALLLTPILRHSIKRHVPLALIDAPKQGTGKGLLSDTTSIIATGSSSPVLTMSDSEEELQKSITSLLMEGATIVTIDNVSGRLQSKHLDAVLTADTWRGRVLGQSRMVTVPQRATWVATGNNIRLGGDLARRCYRIRLDPKVSRPWMRSNFKHPDLATWVTEHRAELIAALLTLARAWFAAGQPMSDKVPALGTFTGWAKMIGGILEHCGISGFLTNLEQLYDEADEESAQWETFFTTWHELFGDEWKTTAQIYAILEPAADNIADSVADSVKNQIAESLPEYLQVALKENAKSFAIKLGKALEKRVDACFGIKNLRLERGKDSHTKGKRWRIIADSADSSTTYAQREKNDDYHESSGANNQSKSSVENYPHYPQGENGHIALNGSTSAANSHLPASNGVNTLSASGTLSAESKWEEGVL